MLAIGPSTDKIFYAWLPLFAYCRGPQAPSQSILRQDSQRDSQREPFLAEAEDSALVLSDHPPPW